MAALIPDMPAPATRTVPIGFFSAIIALLFDLTGHFNQLIRFESCQRLLFVERSSRLKIESSLRLISTCLEQRHRINTIRAGTRTLLSLIHISEPTRRTPISYAVFCLKKKKI